MLLPVIVFFVVSGGILGWYALSSSDITTRRQVDRRLRELADGPDDEPVLAEYTVLKREVGGPIPALDRFLARTRIGGRLRRLIEQSGVKTTSSAMLLLSLASAVVCGGLGFVFAKQAYVIPPAALVGAFVPFGWLRYRRTKRREKFEEQFPEALDLLSRAVRAGHAFQTALGMAADELAAPVGPELKKTFDQQNFGLPLRDALNELAERVSIMDVRFFVTAVLIQRETGGNLSEILDNLSHVVRERFKIQRQVRVHTAHGRFTGYVLLALPAFLAIAMSVLNPDHMQLLFRERMGQTMLMGAMVMQAVGYVWIKKVITIEV